MVKVDIEYCSVCNFESQCKELQAFLNISCPEAEVICRKGRRGSFEVSIDEKLVHSKLQTLAFPEYEHVAENVKNSEMGLPVTKKVREQPITNCVIS